MKFTGERMIPEFNKEDLIYAEHMARYFFAGQFVAAKDVLDVASGSGYGTRYLSNKGAAKVVGVDNSREAVKYSQEKYQTSGIEFILADAAKLPFENDIFDIVVSFETIEHLDDQEKFLREIKRVLRKDGLLIISTPNVLVFPKGNTFHKKELAPFEFRDILSRYFKNIKIFHQHNLAASYILEERAVLSDFLEFDARNLKLIQTSADKNMYVIVIAGNGQLPQDAAAAITLFGNKELEEKTACLQEIYDSRGFKIISFLRRLRSLFNNRKSND